MAISLLAYVVIFSDSFIFGKAISSQFFRVTFFKVSQELLFQRSSFLRPAAFFEELLFQNTHFFPAFFFRISTCSEQNFENRKLFSAVTFQNSYPQKTSTEELLFRSRFFCTTSTEKQDFGKSYFSRKAKFHITYFFYRATFLMSFSSIATFYSSYIFRRASFSQHTVSEELIFHRYPSFPQLHFLLTNH